MKDPLEKEPSPYETLGISPDASQREIHQALAKYLRSRKKPVHGVKAHHELSNILGRLEIDLFSYPFEEIRTDALPVEDHFDIGNYCDVPEPDAYELFPDLDRTDYSRDFGEISYKDMSINRIDAYDAHPECDIEEEFDV
jgi:hypothetical protein